MSMYTDPESYPVWKIRVQIEGNCVFTYLDAFSTEEDFEGISYRIIRIWMNSKSITSAVVLGDVKVKKFLNNVLQEAVRTNSSEQDMLYLKKTFRQVYHILTGRYQRWLSPEATADFK